MNASPTALAGHRAFAWGVHLFTATGVVWGLLAIIAIQQENWRLAFWWIAATLIVDGLDGTLARLAKVKQYLPGFDGALLDNMIDYLNYVLVPALMLIKANMLPAQFTILGAALILLASAYQFCQADAKTEDHYFKGFPSYWNVLVVFLFIIGSNPWVNLAIILIFVILVFVPIKYIYPSRTQRHRSIMLVASYAWGVVGFLVLLLYPHVPAILIYLSLAYAAFYVLLSLYQMIVKPKKA